MNFYSISSFFAFIFCTFLSAFVIFSSHDRTFQKKIFGLTTFFIGIWCFFPFLLNISPTKAIALFCSRILYIFAIIVPAIFFHFMLVATDFIRKKIERKILFLSYFFSFVFLCFINTSFFIKDISFTSYRRLIPGVIYFIFILYFVFMYMWGTYCLVRAYKRQKGIIRERLKYIGLAFALASPSGLIHFASAYGIREIFPHDILVIIYSSIMAYAILKYQLMDIKIAITRAGLFLIVYTLVLGFPFWAGYHTKSWFIATSFMFVLATVGPLIYRFLQKKAENVLLARQKHYQKILFQAAKGMVREHNLHRLEKLIVHIVKKAVKIEFAAIFLEDKEKKCYSLRAVRDHRTFPKNFVFPSGHDLIKYIKEKQAVLVYENVNHFFKEFTDNRVHLLVPTFVEDRLLGFLILGEKHDRSLYTEEDINVFNILSHQTALAIENCSFFEEFKNAQEKIFLAEKLASIGGMADGVAHQIKNRLNHFSIAAGEMQFEIKDFIRDHPGLVKENPKLKKSFDYLTGIAESLITNVKRTDGIIRGILNYARTSEKDTFFSEFSFREIVDLALDLLKVKHEVVEIPLVADLGKDDIVFGVKAQLLEVLYNILDNGYEAIQEKIGYFHLSGEKKEDFHPGIVLKLTQNPNNSLIEVSDNGIGVKDEDKQKIFAPFFTTKSSYKSGTGIGMYVVKRLIEENHGGKVWFKTKYKEGTTFLIKLKKK